MKDIYSPLEIDEEWDQRAPDMGGEEGGTAVAVAPAPVPEINNGSEPNINMGDSTLAPEQTAGMPAEGMDTAAPAPSAGDMVMPNEGMVHDPAHDLAQEVVQSNVDSENTPSTPATLEINDMNSAHEDAPATEPTTTNEGGGTDAASMTTEAQSDMSADSQMPPEPMKVSVMGDEETDEADTKSPEAGSVIEPQVKPEGKEDEPTEPANDEHAVEDDSEKPELPSSPVEDNTKAEKEGVAVAMKPEVAEMDEADMDSTDKRLMAAMERWREKKAQEIKDLTELRDRVESDIAKMNDEITDLQGKVSTKEGELDSIGQLLDEIGDIEAEPEAA